MSVEARGAAAEPDPANCPAGRADHSGQYRFSGHSARDRAPTQANAGPVRDNRVVIDLVTRARTGDKQAWDAIVERYASLVWSICRRHRLGDADAEDVGQSVWLRLLEQLDEPPRSGRASGLAGHHDPAGMHPGPERGAGTSGGQVRAER